VLDIVSDHLGNTPAVCRASYVHPLILDAFTEGALQQRWDATSARGSRLLVPEERRLLHLLAPPRRRSARAGALAA
jgi:DNA topoisomerase-1